MEGVPILNLANPAMTLLLLVLTVLCLFLSHNMKSNSLACVVLLIFATILVGHTVELVSVNNVNQVIVLVKCIAVDEIFVLLTFLGFLYIDRLQIEENKKKAKKNKSKGKGKNKEEQVIENDGLDFLFKKV